MTLKNILQMVKEFKDSLFFRHVKLFMTLLYHLIKVRRISPLSQSLAYTTILSLVPLFAIFFSILGKITEDEKVLQQIKDFLAQYFIPQYGASILDTVEQLSANSVTFGVFGLPTLILIGGFLYFKMDRSINSIWELDLVSNWIKSGQAFFMTLFLGPILLVLAFSLPPYLYSLPYYKELTEVTFVSTLLSLGFPVLVTAVGLYLLYRYIPHTLVWHRSALIGGLVAGVLLQISNWTVNWYLYNMSRFNIIYGSLAIFPIFLLWLYVVWMVVLIGAAITFLVQKYSQTGLRSRFTIYNDESLFASAISVMVYLVQAFQQNKAAPTFEEIHLEVNISRSRLGFILNVLGKEGLVSRFIDERLKGRELFRYQPAMAPAMIKLNTFFDLFYPKNTKRPFDAETEEILKVMDYNPGVLDDSFNMEKLVCSPQGLLKNLTQPK